ncbi:hypothetical protein CYY_002237 [Polysphondylium violaceum]|uniref:Vacuolar protein sorting-associated protein 13 family protein n=1 Tax=Polysphondylium violaceum TaxID=133409 RepID=A0A8J4Q1W5_9MYCE|nr:hypothetical protein CYY_002237 [Polysphondylium violaceum]
MVSQIAASVLGKYLGDYVDDLNADNIKLSFLSGDAVLQDLKIKKTVLQSLFPNVVVKQAIIRKLSLHIPWKDLKGKPAIIKIEGVYVLAESGKDFDEQFYRKKFQDEKQAKLHVQELIRNKIKEVGIKTAAAASEETGGGGFGSKLVSTVIDNLQLYIDSVHIRFEDKTDNNWFAVGVTLNKLNTESTDENWVPTFLKNDSSIIHKTIDLDQLSVYWNTDTKPIKYSSLDDLSNKLKLMINSNTNNSESDSGSNSNNNNNNTQQQYILPSVSAQLKAILNKSLVPSSTVPKYDLEFELGSTEFCLSDKQYRDITNIMEGFQLFKKSIEYRSSRPKEQVLESPKKWWKYSIGCVLQKIHEKRYKNSWPYIKEFLRDKKEYIKLFRKLKKKTIFTTEQTRLESLEWKLPYEHILLFRNLAYKMIEKEDKLKLISNSNSSNNNSNTTTAGNSNNNMASKATPISSPSMSSSTSTPAAGKGWFSSWWAPVASPTGTSPLSTSVNNSNSSSNSNNNVIKDIELTKEDWNEIYSSIGYTETTEESKDTSTSPLFTSDSDLENIVKTRVNFHLVQGGIRLTRKNKPLALLKLDQLSLNLKSKSSSFVFEGNLGGIELVDHSNKKTQFEYLIKPLLKQQQPQQQDSSDINNRLFNIILSSYYSPKSPIQYDLSVRSKPLTIVYYPQFIQIINNFFFSNKNEANNAINVYEDLEKMAQDTISSIKTQTKDKLLLAISNQTKISMMLELDAPIIIIPESITDPNTNMLVLDLGKLSINHSPLSSKLLVENTISSSDKPESTESKDKEPLNDNNITWEEFYDEYSFKLTNTQVLLAKKQWDWRSESLIKKYRMNIANPFNANFSLKISKLSNQFLTSLKLVANVEFLEFYLSSSQYVDFMSIIQAAINVQSPPSASVPSSSTPPLVPNSGNSNDQPATNKMYSRDVIDNFKILEAVFNFERFNLNLSLEDDNYRHHSMALVYLRGLKGSLDQKLMESVLQISVNGLWIEDCLQKEKGNGNYLATSTTHFNPTDNLEGLVNNTILLKLTQINTDSPYYKNIDKLVDIEFSQINFILNRKTVAGLIEFLNSVSNLSVEKQKRQHQSIRSSSGVATNTPLKRSISASLDQFPSGLRSPPVASGSSTSNTVLIKVSLKVDLVRILLTKENNTPLIKASFTQHVMVADIYANKTSLNGKLGSAKIYDMTLEGRNYRTILTTKERNLSGQSSGNSNSSSILDSIEDDELSSSTSTFTASTATAAATGSSLIYFQFESDAQQQTLKVNLSSIRYVFLKRFVEELRLFLNNVMIMREYLKSSIYSAASAISNNRTTFYYEIEIDNPYILIPLSSLSNKIFIVDLGKIAIKNTIDKPPCQSTGTGSVDMDSNPIVTENIYIDARNIKVLSGLNMQFDKNQNGSSVRTYGSMVRDVNLSIHLKTPMYYSLLQKGEKPANPLPQWERWFNISQFELNISEYELVCLVDLLDGNLSEFSSEIVYQDSNSSSGTGDTGGSNNKMSESIMIVDKKQIKQQQQQEQDEQQQEEEEEIDFEKLIGSSYWKLGKFSIMYMKRDGSKMGDRLVLFEISESKMDITLRAMETSVYFEIKNIMMKDFNSDTHQQLRSILLPLADKKSTDAESEPQVIIKASLKPPPIQQSLFQIYVKGVYMIFVPHAWLELQDSILKILKFTMDAWNRYTIKVFGEPPVSEEIIQSGLSLFTLSISDIKISMPGNSKISGLGEQENALIVRSSLDIQSTSKGAMGVETILLIEANNIQIYRNQINNPDVSNIKIIEPFKVIYQVTQTLKNSESNLSLDNIIVHFSYRDFKHLMKIVNATVEALPSAPSSEASDKPHFLHKYREDQDTPDDQHEALYSPTNEPMMIPQPETLIVQKFFTFQLQKGGFVLLDDHNKSIKPVPLLAITVKGLKSNLFTFPQKNQVACSVECGLDSNYYNRNIGVWEPLIESWGLTFTANLSIEGGWMVNFQSKIPLQVNITKGFVDTSISTYQIWADDYYNNNSSKSSTGNTTNTNTSQQALQAQQIEKEYPYYLRNDTGVDLWYWVDSKDIRQIGSGTEVPLDIKEEVDNTTTTTTTTSTSNNNNNNSTNTKLEKKISFQLFGDFKPINNIPIDSIGTYTIHPMPEFKHIKLLYDVSYRNGSKLLCLHSNFNIQNNTDIPVVANITAVLNKEPKSLEIILGPHVKIPIPVEFTTGRIKMKPYNLGYDYSNEKIDCLNIIQLMKQKNTNFNINNSNNNNNNNNNNSNSNNDQNENHNIYSKMICKHNSKLPFIFSTSIAKNNLKSKNYVEISIDAPIMIENVLACDLNFRLYHGKNKKLIGSPFISGTIPIGKKLPVLVFDPLLDIYMEIQIYDFPYSSAFLIETFVGLPIPDKIKIVDGRNQPLLISFDNRIEPNHGYRFLSIYCEFWMINQTGLPLFFRHQIGAQTIDPAGQTPTNEIKVPDKPVDSRLWYSKDWAHPSKPFMFAYNDSTIVGGRFCLKISDSNWSSPFSLNSSSSANSNIQISEERSDEEKEIKNLVQINKLPPKTNYQLSVNILPSNSKFWRTRVVTFSPMYLIVNTTQHRVYYQQFECENNTQTILQDESLPFQFPSTRREKLIRIGIAPSSSDDIKWSGYFNPKELSHFALRLRSDSEVVGSGLKNKDKKDSEISTKKKISNLLIPSSSATSSLSSLSKPLQQQQQQQLQDEDTSNESRLFISVTIRVKATKNLTTTMIVLHEQNADLPPYKIDNKSKYPIWIRQKKTEIWEKVAPLTCIPYTWDHPILPRKLIVEFPGNEKKTYRLDNLEENSIVVLKSPEIQQKTELEVMIIANGPTRVLSIKEKQRSNPPSPIFERNNSMSTSTPKSPTQSSSSTINSNGKEENDKFEINIQLSSVGISIINSNPIEEIIYISLDGITLDVKQSKLDQYIQFKLDDMQIDDQRYQTNFPVFLCQTKKINHLNSNNNSNNNNSNNNNNNAGSIKPFIQFSATRSFKYPKIIFFRYFSLLIQECDVNIDESSILNALSFINVNLTSLNEHFTLNPTITQEEILQTKNASNISNHLIYFEMLHINPLKVNLSFVSCKSPKEAQAILGARSLAELLIGFKSNSPFLNIERAPIKCNGFIWEHPFLSTKQVLDEISLHFSYQLMGQVHKIFGSFDFIGNPIRLAESLGSGFKDFFHEPALGLVKSPQDFAVGLSKGTSSLINNSVFGFCDSTSKITGTISKGLVQLSLDDNYIKERQESHKQKASGVKQGIEFGIRDLGEGVLKGITGIIEEPIKGATQEKSWEGFFKGVGKGVLGVAVKPTVGVFEFVSRTSEGIKNSTSVAKSMALIKRRRPPRFFPKEGTLQPYNIFKSTGSSILYSNIGSPPSNSGDWYIFHCNLSKELILMVSNSHIILFRSMANISPLTLEIVWKINLSGITSIKGSTSNPSIYVTYQENSKIPPSTINIPTQTDELRTIVIRKINELALLVHRFGAME